MAEIIKVGGALKPPYGISIRVKTDPMLDGYYVFLHTKDSCVTQVVLEPREPGKTLTPLMTVSARDATLLQNLFNDLWREGFRPADGTGNAGHLQAIQGHLEDMRRVAFHELGIKS